MLESDFRAYLRNARHFKETTISRRIANCRRVERYEGDLDQHFDNDQCRSLLCRLTYSAEDYHRQQQPRHNIPINGNLRTGSATLKQAVTHYVQFRRSSCTSIKVEGNGSATDMAGEYATRSYSDSQQQFSRTRTRREENPQMSCGCLITGAMWAIATIALVILVVLT